MTLFSSPFNRGNHDFDNFDTEDHEEFTEHLRKTLYFGKNPSTDRPSMPFTDIAVQYFQESAPRQLGKLDMYTASANSRQACMSPTSMVNGMLYVRRLRQRNSAYLHKVSSSDLFFISVMMASKFLYDEGIDDEVFNDEWAASADMETEDVNELEREFLKAIDWNLFIKDSEFKAALQDIEKRIALKQGTDRGWFTYTDLWVLLHDPDFSKLASHLTAEMSKVVVVSCVAYFASIMTMVGSTLLVSTISSTMSLYGPALFVPHQPQITQPKPICNGTGFCRETTQEVEELGEPSVSVGGRLVEEQSDQENQVHCKKRSCASSGVKSFVTTVLSQLLAVLTLRGSTHQNLSMNQLGKEQRSCDQSHGLDMDTSWSEQVCAMGPCLSSSPKFCQNVTSQSPFSSWFSSGNDQDCETTSLYCQKCNRQGPNCVKYCNSKKNPSRWSPEHDSALEVVRCCCSGHREVQPSGQGQVLRDKFMDLSAGFVTGIDAPSLIHIQT